MDDIPAAVVANDVLRKLAADASRGGRGAREDCCHRWPERAELVQQIWRDVFAVDTPDNPPPWRRAEAAPPLAVQPTAGSHDEPLLGHYRVEGEIGRGGQGVVHRAVDVLLQRSVALKTLRCADLTVADQLRLWREARAAARLRHPALCTVYDAGECRGQVFVAMELLAGPTLHQCIGDHLEREDSGPVALPTSPGPDVEQRLRAVLDLIASVTSGLQHAHEHGLVHRDLKPSNVSFSADLEPVVLDFGLSINVGEHDCLAGVGAVPGTPGYVAPERLADSGSSPTACSPRLDIWSLGVLLYVLASGGHAPFRTSPFPDWLEAVHRGPPPRLSGLSPSAGRSLDALLEHALQPNPELRIPSCTEFLRRVRDIAREVHPR